MEDVYKVDVGDDHTVAVTSTAAAATVAPISCPDDHDTVRHGNYTCTPTDFHTNPVLNNSMLQFEVGFPTATESSDSEMADFIKAQIANHPGYPNLLSAYIDCQKVGATPEMASILEKIGRENHRQRSYNEIGSDPELDEFMESYCEALQKYKEELSKHFNEASAFLCNIESQLSKLCNGELAISNLDYRSDQEGVGGTSEEEFSYAEVESWSGGGGEEDVKGMLMRKYSGYLSGLRKDFLKKRKKGKLPKDARITLLDWWNAHYRWPHPTSIEPHDVLLPSKEEEKTQLSEVTGLDQKQISNWFINQRKRHWKPSQDMKLAFLEDIGGEHLYLQSGGHNSNHHHLNIN